MGARPKHDWPAIAARVAAGETQREIANEMGLGKSAISEGLARMRARLKGKPSSQSAVASDLFVVIVGESAAVFTSEIAAKAYAFDVGSVENADWPTVVRCTVDAEAYT